MCIKNSDISVKHRSNAIDKLVGERLRMRRLLLRMSQRQLAKILGLTFQQVQKYEKGSSCISAGRLWNLSEILNVPIHYFFQGANENLAKAINTDASNGKNDPMVQTETIKLVYNYYKLQNRQLAGQIFDLLDRIANLQKK